MSSHFDFKSAEPAAVGAPWVIVYVVALTIFGYGWSRLEPPTTSLLELRATTAHTTIRPSSYHYTP
jgi:hypothetical protein